MGYQFLGYIQQLKYTLICNNLYPVMFSQTTETPGRADDPEYVYDLVHSSEMFDMVVQRLEYDPYFILPYLNWQSLRLISGRVPGSTPGGSTNSFVSAPR